MLRAILAMALFIFPTVLHAQGFVGQWDIIADGKIISRIEISEANGRWSANWRRPTDFVFDGNTFEKLKGPVVVRTASNIQVSPNEVEIIFPDPAPDSIPDVFRLCPVEGGRLLLDYVGMGYEPIALDRSRGGPLGSWTAGERFTRTVIRTRNREIARLASEDQRDREDAKLGEEALAKVDASRRASALVLLNEQKLSSGYDFYDAALIFQHGAGPEDYLLAHVLATIAIARGNSDARWLASASLDRYLQSVGQPQIFGTQFATSDASTTSRYTPNVLSDIVRKYMKVPPLAEQDELIKRQAGVK